MCLSVYQIYSVEGSGVSGRDGLIATLSPRRRPVTRTAPTPCTRVYYYYVPTNTSTFSSLLIPSYLCPNTL